jgi:hypothetical protein
MGLDRERVIEDAVQHRSVVSALREASKIAPTICQP